MRSRKSIAYVFLFIILFSTAYSLLPIAQAFAAPSAKETVFGVGKTKPMVNKLETVFRAPVNVDSGLNDLVRTEETSASTVGSLPIPASKQVKDGVKSFFKTDLGKDLQNDEVAALRNLRETDMCDRTGAGLGVGHPTFLQILFLAAGDAKDLDDMNDSLTDNRKDNFANFAVRPEMVPSTSWDCFPEIWKKTINEIDWEAFQDANGTKTCGRFNIGCKVEQLIKNWVRSAIVTGMTWILDIATGSGSGEAAEACRPDRGAGGTTGRYNPNSKVSDFTASQARVCSNYLNEYYAIASTYTSSNDNTNTQEYALSISGLKDEPIGSDGKFDREPVIGTGDTSINSDASKSFYNKSSNIGYLLAFVLVIGAVIQAMIQGKPAIMFKVVLILVPLFGVSLMLAPILSKNLMQIVDGVSYYFAGDTSSDIENVASSFGTTIGSVAGSAGTTIGSAVTNPAVAVEIVTSGGVGGAAAKYLAGPAMLAEIMKTTFMVLIGIAGFFIMVAFALWALMMVREASILLVLVLLPIALSMNIWPVLAKISHKFIKLLISLIISKIPIVLAMSYGLGLMSDWVTTNAAAGGGLAVGSVGDTGGLRIFIMGIVIFMLALAAPTFIISLFDAVGEAAGSLGRDMHKGLTRTGNAALGVKANLGTMGKANRTARTGLSAGVGTKLPLNKSDGDSGNGVTPKTPIPDVSAGGNETSAPSVASSAPKVSGGDKSALPKGADGGHDVGSQRASGLYVPSSASDDANTTAPSSSAPSTASEPLKSSLDTAPPSAPEKKKNSFNAFREGVAEVGNQIQFDEKGNQRLDGYGRPLPSWRNGGVGMRVGGGLVKMAQENQANKNPGSSSRAKTYKNRAIAVAGAYIHGQGNINAAGGMRGKIAAISDGVKGQVKAYKSIN